jgi:tRNA(Ile)-lysidine synthase
MSERRNSVRHNEPESQGLGLARVQADGLLAAGRPVVVLFSGGRDSTCLLDLALRIVGLGWVQALHVNHRLRQRAEEDERHCRWLAQELGVPLHVRHLQRPQSGNVQAWARAERYRAAAELAGDARADVAAGHTATDQVETILYRLASSPSRRALLGMAHREELTAAPGRCQLIRPLLAFSREQTAEYCRRRGLTWCEDESNESDAYARARIRTRLVPELKELHPAAEENVLALAAILREEAEVLDGLVQEALGGQDEIELAALRSLPLAIQRLLVQRLADAAAGRPAPGTARRAEEVAALGRDAALDLPHGVRAVAAGGVLRFERQPTGGRSAERGVRQ